MPPLAPFLESSGNYWTQKALSLQLWTFCKVLLTSQLLPQFPCRWVAHSGLTWLAGNKRLWAAFHVPCRSSDRKSFALNLYFTIWQQVQNWLKSGVDCSLIFSYWSGKKAVNRGSWLKNHSRGSAPTPMDIGVYLKFSLCGRHKKGKEVGEEKASPPSLPSPPPFFPFSQSPTPSQPKWFWCVVLECYFRAEYYCQSSDSVRLKFIPKFILRTNELL